MKQLFLLLTIGFLLVSCSPKIAKVIEPNVAFTDAAMAAAEIDTIHNLYVTSDRDLFLYTKAFFEKKDSIADGVIHQKKIFDGDQLIVPKRTVRIKKGKKIKDENGNDITDPFWNEIIDCIPSDNGPRYAEIHLAIEGGENISGGTFVLIPESFDKSQNLPKSKKSTSSGNITLRGTVQTEREKLIQKKDKYNNTDYRYVLQLVTCGFDCNPQEIYERFLVEDGSQRVYMIYKGTVYYITLSLDGTEWYVPAQSAGYSISGLYCEKTIEDKREQEFAKSKQIGK